ncbi:DUF4145 domain-containing protein [Sphingomonas sp. 22176]|uniref:DUF4145 domain-containing protein n=1 Tax=Sphingomonas sp. 22176 TaxID=3453884 RepID=UPI003F852EF8
MDQQVDGGSTYSIFRCGACDTVCYRSAFWDSEDADWDEDGHPIPIVRIRQYPPPASEHFTFNTDYVPRKLSDILDETLQALAGSQMILATIGLRLAVEFIVKDKQCAGRSLAKRTDDLHAQGHVDEDQKKILHRIRERGNAGAHDAKGMTAAEIVAGMSIVDGLLEKLYNMQARNDERMKNAKKLLDKDDLREFEDLIG